MQGKRGNTVAIVLVIVLVLGAILFFVSKPFQTRVKQATRQATEWTPENIQKDPVGYLSWALAECGKTEEKLQASRLALKTNRNNAERSLSTHQADQTAYTKLLDEAKSLYRQAGASASWPAELRGVKMEEAVLKAKIVEAHDKLSGLGELIATYQQSRQIIDRKLVEVEAKLTEVTKLESKLSTDLEIAKVRKTVEGIGTISDQLNAIVDTSEALVSATKDGISLEELVKPSGERRVETEFEKIMAQ
jgi:hypothetical protein